MSDLTVPTVEVFGVTWTQAQLVAFLDAIPDGAHVSFGGSVFNEVADFQLDGWPNLGLVFIGNAFDSGGS